LAIDKGFIEDEEVRPIEQEPEFSDDPLPHDGNDEEEKAPFMNSGLDSAYTCLYTAMKDGHLKTGECFSNAKDTQSAKADAISKLANLGFTSIEIIAVEQGDTAARGEPEVANVGSVENIYSDEEASDDETMITEADEDEGAEDTTEATAEDDSPSDEDPLLSAAGKDDAEDETSDEAESSSDEVEVEDTSSSSEEVEETPEDEETEEKEISSEEETVEENPEETPKEDSKEEEPSEDSSEEKPEKDKNNELYEEYIRIWKQVLKNMEKTSFQELSLKEKGNFFRQLGDRWTNEIDPSEFMTPERTKTVEEITITI
jgi:hypothetical protein